MGRTVESIVIEHIRATKKVLRIAGIMVLPVGFAAYLIPDAHAAGIYFFIGISVVIGAALIVMSLGDPAKHKSLSILRDRPNDVVWVYVHKVTGQNQNSHVMLGLADGSKVAVPAKVGDESELIGAIAQVVPGATLGFDPAHERTFKNNPSALLQA